MAVLTRESIQGAIPAVSRGLMPFQSVKLGALSVTHSDTIGDVVVSRGLFHTQASWTSPHGSDLIRTVAQTGFRGRLTIVDETTHRRGQTKTDVYKFGATEPKNLEPARRDQLVRALTTIGDARSRPRLRPRSQSRLLSA